MIKYILVFVFVTAILQANYDEANCKSEVKEFIYQYSLGEKLYNEKKYLEATQSFEKSKKFAFLALESCKEDLYYDSMYEYITSSEIQINMIEDIVNEN